MPSGSTPCSTRSTPPIAEGWTDAAGADARRRDLAEEAIWLGRLVAALLPDEPEALGLLALMLHAEARRRGAAQRDGDYVPLAEQDTALWDARLIDEAEALLPRASRSRLVGRYQLEAAVQSAHVGRRLTGATDWAAIKTLYDALFAITGSPVVAINRAIAIAETHGPPAGLTALDALSDDPRLLNISLIGRRGPGCCRALAVWRRPRALTFGRLGWNPILWCGASFNRGVRSCCRRRALGALKWKARQKEGAREAPSRSMVRSN